MAENATEEKRGETSCGSCGKKLGSNVSCLPCRDAAARELSNVARDVTDDDRLRSRGEAGARFAEKPPWYARFAPKGLLPRLELLSMLAKDYAAGRYRRIPWRTIAMGAAAVAYIVSPLDLVPDLLVPIGWTDDMLVLALIWTTMKQDLRDYCKWKGLAPSRYDL